MIAGYAMLVLALGALLMVLCTGFGDTDDEERDNVEDPRRGAPRSPDAPPDARPLGAARLDVRPHGVQPPDVWLPESDAALRRLRGRGFGLG